MHRCLYLHEELTSTRWQRSYPDVLVLFVPLEEVMSWQPSLFRSVVGTNLLGAEGYRQEVSNRTEAVLVHTRFVGQKQIQ